MEAHQQVFRIQSMCRALGVSRSGFYAWRRRQSQPSARQQRRRHLDDAVKTAFETKKGRSGSPGLTRHEPNNSPPDRDTRYQCGCRRARCVFPLFLHLRPCCHERRLFAGLRLGDVNGYRPDQCDYDLFAD